MQSFCDVFYANAATAHALVSLKALTYHKLLKPQKLCVSLTSITLELCMIHDNILIA
jgi:hypothetical protein